MRDSAAPTPCHVQVRFAGQVFAEALADLFRPALLQTGHGHGHHGFAAALRRPLPPGPCTVQMHLARHGISAPMPIDVPALQPPVSRSVESLLRAPPGWTTRDVAAHPACLALEHNLAALGPARFVDAVFRFALERWPSDAELSMNVASLRAGRIAPEALLLDCLGSRERADMPAGLLGPHDAHFPFLPPAGGQDGAA